MPLTDVNNAMNELLNGTTYDRDFLMWLVMIGWTNPAPQRDPIQVPLSYYFI
jgi:hypothetical protein